MRVNIEFNLADPDDKIEYKLTRSSEDMYLALHAITRELRARIKHPESYNVSSDQVDGLEMAREILFEELSEYNLLGLME